MESLIPLALLGVMMWFLLIRPQQQRVRRQQALLSSLQVGDRVVTAGGMIGEIVSLDSDRASVRLAPDVVVEFLRVAISQRVDEIEPGTSDVEELGRPTDTEEGL